MYPHPVQQNKIKIKKKIEKIQHIKYYASSVYN
jgi:hypothetical protein